ncbi:MAG: transglutaminase domain-containing protein [Blautia sp.]|nr:transglutaminase domain-containing protein [Blautia sp.]
MERSMIIRGFVLPFLLVCLLIAGCGGSGGGTDTQVPPVFDKPHALVPESPGQSVIESDSLLLDLSNIKQGYLTAISRTPDRQINVQLMDPEGINYSYFLEPQETAVIPFSGGSGNYQLVCYEQVAGSQYAAMLSKQLEIELENEFLPFLYPNQYVDFAPDSEAVKLAISMLPDDASDIDALGAIYDYVIGNTVYDEAKAVSVEAGYLPDVDETLATGRGICFDYAALMSAMLRTRGIPCKLMIGYAGDIKHAWIDVYLLSKGWISKAISFDGKTWTRMDPTFDSSAEDREMIQEYIGEGSNYAVQFMR